MAEEGRNIRSVIKNATQGGLSNRLGGIGDTIATKEEIVQNKEKPETPKMGMGPKIESLGGLSGGLNLKRGESTGKSEVVSQPKVEQGGQNTAGGISINQQPPVSSPFQNQMNEPINNINVEQFDNESIRNQPIDLNLRKGIPATLRLKELDKDRKKRMSKGVENLYIDAYNRNVNGGELTIEDVLANKNYQQQLKGMDENVLAEMINDANYLAQFDYSTDNVLSLMDKYKDLGLDIDMDNLPPMTKNQYIAANLEGNDGGLGGLIDHISPMNVPAEIYEGFTGVNPRDYNEKMQQWAQESKHDFLTDTELEEMISDARKVVDNKYKDYYYNQTEEMFTDRKVGEQFYKDVAKLRKENKDMSEEEAVAKVMKEGKYNGVSYEKLPHETVDQGRFWKDKDKEKEYNKVIKELEGKAKKAHGDTRENWWRNLGLDATLVVGQGLDLVRNPGSLASGLASMVKGAGHKAIEGYADLLDTWIATTESAIGAIQGKNEWNGIEYRVGEVGEKVAKKKGYENYDDMVMKMEQASKDNPGLKIATWFLKQGQKDLNTANALGDYLVNAYGSWEAVKEMANENQAQMASDIVSIIQLGTMGAVKMGLIDAMKGEQIIKMAGYGDLYEQTLKWGNKLQFGPMIKGEMAVAKAGAKVVGAPFKLVGNFTETFVNKLSGITKEERDFIKKNPEKVEEFLKGDNNSQSLLDKITERFEGLQLEKKLEGEEYEKIRNSNAPVKISDMLSSISNRLKKGGLEFTNEGVKVNKNYTPAINNKFTELGAFLDELRNKGNSATAEDVRWARRQIDTLAKWEGQPAGLEADAIGLIRDIRGILDAELKRQIPDMKVLDDSYKKTITEVKEMKQDWFNKDGTLKDSAYSKIRNLTNKGSNQPKLARLEKLLPGITEELRGLAVAESIERAGKQMVGQYANQIFGVGGGITAITSLLSGGLSAGPIILGVLGATLATPKNLVKLLKYQGKVSKGFNNIISKIENGIKLTPAETLEFTRNLNDNQEQLKKDARYLYERGLITDEEYKAALEKEEKDYSTAVDKARAKIGDKEKALKDKEKGKVIEDAKKRAKNVGFVVEIEKDLEAGGGEKAMGLADIKNKIIKLSEDMTDTTAQHELFHAVMSVVDGKTRKYVIDEAKKILKDKGISDVNAEEWLAESFGIYAKRKQVNLGVLDKVKWGDGKIRAIVGDLFQRVYEWLQNYNGDRKTINKLFDEILDDKVKIGENGGVDLSYLLGDKDVKLGEGAKGNGLMYKKTGKMEEKGYTTTSQGGGLVAKNQKSLLENGKRASGVATTPSSNLPKGAENSKSALFGYKGEDGEYHITVRGNEVRVKDNKKARFTEGNVELSDKNKVYYDNLVKGLKGLERNGYSDEPILIGKTSRGKDITITDRKLVHIFKEHGQFDLADLVEAVNSEKGGFWETEVSKGFYESKGLRPRIEKDIPGKDEVLLVGLEPKGGSNELNAKSYEVKSFRQSNPSTIPSREVRFKKARHGSPYSFEKFDSSHMGEGEGAQAHGWGHYVAVNKETGLNYGKMGARKYQGKQIGGFGNLYSELDASKEYSIDVTNAVKEISILADRENISIKEAKQKVLERRKEWLKDAEERLEKAKKRGIESDIQDVEYLVKRSKKLIDTIKDINEKDFNTRNLYELEIPDPVKRDTPTGSNYLEEDKYYSKAEVKKFLDLMKNIDSGWLKDTKESRIYDLYKKGLDIRGKDLYDMLAYAKGDKEASKFLESLGYDGIHYYGGRDGEAYVLFNDNAPQIQNHIRYKKAIENNRESMKKDLIERAKSGFYDRLKGEQDEFLDDVADATGSYAVKAPLKYGSKGEPEFGIKGKKGERILDKGMNKEGGIRDVNDIARGTIRVDTIGDIYKVVDYIKKNYKNVSDFDDKYAKPTPMGYVDYSLLFEGSEGGKAETQINATPMIVAKEKMKDALNYGISEKEYMEIVKKSGTKGGGLGHTFYDEQRGIITKLAKGGLSKNEIRFLKGRVKTLSRDSRRYYDAYMKLLKK